MFKHLKQSDRVEMGKAVFFFHLIQIAEEIDDLGLFAGC